MTQPSSRDFEQISAYLDGQLSGADAARLESRIKADPELRSVYNGLRQTRSLLRQLPARRAPRNFKLTPQMVGMKAQPRSRIFPFFRLASALAMILLFLGYAVNLSASSSGIQMAAPMGGGIVATEGAYPYDAAASGLAIEETSAAPSELMPAPTEDVAQKLMPVSPTETGEATQQADFAPPTPSPEAVTMVEPTATLDDAMRSLTNPANGNLPQATEDTMMMPYQPEPPVLPIPSFWLFGLLGLAVVSGASAFIVEKRTSGAKPTTKEIVLIVFGLVIVVLLAYGIYWMFLPR